MKSSAGGWLPEAQFRDRPFGAQQLKNHPVRVAIVSSHPIQYHAGWYRALATEPWLSLEVLYCHNATAEEQSGAGFGVPFNWDGALLDGYPYRFLTNVARQPGVSTFQGVDTPSLTQLMRDFDAVVVTGWHYKSAWQAITGCWRARTPVLVRSDSHLHTPRSRAKTAMKYIPYSWFIRRLDACLPVGEWSREYFRHYGASEDRIFTVPHAISESFSTTKSHFDGQSRWNQADGEIRFLFVGKFIPVKRPLDFIDAIRLAHETEPRIRGLMVGDGPLLNQCRAAASASGAPVAFAGFMNQAEIVSAYRASAVLVVTSESETWGLVVNEAMTCGRPVIVSDQVGCWPDLVNDFESGVYKMGDVRSLAEKMVRLASDQERLAQMSSLARKLVQKCSVTVATERLKGALERVVPS